MSYIWYKCLIHDTGMSYNTQISFIFDESLYFTWHKYILYMTQVCLIYEQVYFINEKTSTPYVWHRYVTCMVKVFVFMTSMHNI